jgi:hypothetical protein
MSAPAFVAGIDRHSNNSLAAYSWRGVIDRRPDRSGWHIWQAIVDARPNRPHADVRRRQSIADMAATRQSLIWVPISWQALIWTSAATHWIE